MAQAQRLGHPPIRLLEPRISSRTRAELLPNPVRRSEAACIVMHQERSVRLEHQEPHGLREPRGEPTRVEHFASGDEQAHGSRTVLSVSDVAEGQSLGHVQCRAILRYVRTASGGIALLSNATSGTRRRTKAVTARGLLRRRLLVEALAVTPAPPHRPRRCL